MVGANYMGGKRNTARAKSKDVIGRAQRRHFGKQRLASALCVTQENRVHPRAPTLSSVLPEIALAHARCEVKTDSDATSRKAFRRDRLCSSTPPNSVTRRIRPSKALDVLDTSDHMSIRAAIDRILQQPNLVGINTPGHTDSAYTKPMQTPMAVGSPTDIQFGCEDSDIQRSKITSKQVFGLYVSHSQTPRHELALPKSNLDTGYEPGGGGILSSLDSSSGLSTRDPFDDAGCTEAQLSTGTNLFFCRQGNEHEWPSESLDAVYPLPRSSPFPFSSPSSDNSILNLDTSPCAAVRPGQSDVLSEDDVEYVTTSPLRSIRWPKFRQPSGSCSIREGLTGIDEARLTVSSLTRLNEEVLENERFWTTCYNDDHASPSAENYDSCHSPSSEFAHDPTPVSASKEVTEDDTPNDVSIDFLSDPCPWETIGRILKLNAPEPSAVHSVKVSFTKDREGVGYVSHEGSHTCHARSFDATFETQIGDKLTVDVPGTSSANPPIVDPEVSTTDDRMATDTPDLPCGDNPTQPLFDAGSPSVTPAEVNSYINVHVPQEIPSIPVVHSAQIERTRSSMPFTIAVGATTTDPEITTTLDGPCLFGDSDLEEDE